jgi:hypothetical protein
VILQKTSFVGGQRQLTVQQMLTGPSTGEDLLANVHKAPPFLKSNDCCVLGKTAMSEDDPWFQSMTPGGDGHLEVPLVHLLLYLIEFECSRMSFFALPF